MKSFKEYAIESYNRDKQSQRQITEYLLNTQQFKSFDDFREVLETMLEIEQFVYHYSDVIISLINNAYSSEYYSKNEIKIFTQYLLRDYIKFGQAYSLYWALYRKFWDEEDFVFPISINELKDICYERLVNFVNSEEMSMLKCYNLYHACPEKIDQDRNVTLQERAHPQKLKFLELYPWEYIRSLIRPYMVPIHKNYGNSFTIDPFAKFTFGNWDNFWIFLDKFRNHSEYSTHKQKFEKYYLFILAFKENGYRPTYVEPDKWEEYGFDECSRENNWQIA